MLQKELWVLGFSSSWPWHGAFGASLSGIPIVLAGMACGGHVIQDHRGGDGGGSNSGSRTGNDEDAAAAPNNEPSRLLVHVVCDNVQSCCTAAKRGFDPVQCRQTVIQQYAAPSADTSLVFDSAEAGRCLATINAAAQACAAIDLTACYGAFHGSLPPGTSCQSSYQCAQGPAGYAVCAPDGRCVQPKRGVAGEACSFTCIDGDGTGPKCKSVSYAGGDAASVACHSENGLACVTAPNGPATCQSAAVDCAQNPAGACPSVHYCDVTTSQCYVPPPVGAACSSSPCGPTAYCENGKCATKKNPGATCTTDDECDSSKCEKGSCVVYSVAAATWCGGAVN